MRMNHFLCSSLFMGVLFFHSSSFALGRCAELFHAGKLANLQQILYHIAGLDEKIAEYRGLLVERESWAKPNGQESHIGLLDSRDIWRRLDQAEKMVAPQNGVLYEGIFKKYLHRLTPDDFTTLATEMLDRMLRTDFTNFGQNYELVRRYGQMIDLSEQQIASIQEFVRARYKHLYPAASRAFQERVEKLLEETWLSTPKVKAALLQAEVTRQALLQKLPTALEQVQASESKPVWRAQVVGGKP